jgi:hypothetical protein
VAAAGADAVLKLTTPENDESDEEADALALWAGDGAVRPATPRRRSPCDPRRARETRNRSVGDR